MISSAMQRLVDHRVLRQRNMEPQDSSASFESAGGSAPPVVAVLVAQGRGGGVASGADGADTGQEVVAGGAARRLLGVDAIIGLSVKTVEQAEAAPIELLDYAGIGGVFATSSKDNPDPPIGPTGLGRIVEVFRRRCPEFPLCGIAGIDARNASEVIAAGTDGVAVISALSLKDDPRAAARQLLGGVDEA